MQRLIQVGDGKVADADLGQFLQDLRFAVSVCIRLDNSHDLGVPLQGGGNGTNVCFQGRQRDFSPCAF